MVNVISGVTNAENGVYILWGIAILGLVFKMISNSYIKQFMKKTENMATTKKKKLRCMRQKYENRKSLGMEGNSSDFVEKNLRAFRFMGLPFETFCHHINIGVYVTIMATAGAFLLYEPSWRGSPYMVTFLANSVMVCAFLMSLENIFSTRTKLEIMKANIRDYLDNMSVRGAGNVDGAVRRSAAGADGTVRSSSGNTDSADLRADAKGRNDGAHKLRDKGNRIRDENAFVETAAAEACVEELEVSCDAGQLNEKPPDAENISSEISLEGFLKEFFS
jgi:hypothetical protein